MYFRNNNNDRGFTIVELVSVIAIIMILIGLLMPALNSARRQARKKQAEAIIGSLEVAINMYYTDIGNYPTALSALVVDPSVSGWLGPYMDTRSEYYDSTNNNFVDPWGNNYVYSATGTLNNTGRFDLSSGGPTTDVGDDITNW